MGKMSVWVANSMNAVRYHSSRKLADIFCFFNASSANNASAFGKLYTCTQLIHAHLVRRCVHTPRHWDFHYNLFRMRRNARCAATYTNTN